MRDKVKLILPTSWEPNQKEFFAVLGISSSGFGEQLFKDVYNALFISSIEVKSEFNKYYSVEYTSLAEYLEIRYGKILSEDDLDADRVFIVTWLPQVINCDYEDSWLETILKCIKKLEGAQDEDQI